MAQNTDDYKVILRRFLEAGYKKPIQVATKAKEAVYVFGKKVKGKIDLVVTSQRPPLLPKTKEVLARFAKTTNHVDVKDTDEGMPR